MENKPNTNVVSFHIYRKDGSPNPDIKQSFLDRRNITAMDALEATIRLEDKTEWKLVLEPKVKEQLKQAHHVYCIVSFQVRSSGNYAVCRLFDETRKGGKRK